MPEKAREDIAPERLVFSDANHLHQQTSAAGKGIAGFTAPEKTPAPKLGSNYQPVIWAQPAKGAAASEPGKGALDGVIVGPSPNTSVPEPDTLKTVSPDQRQAGYVTSVSSTQIAVQDANAGPPAALGNPQADTEAFHIHLSSTLGFATPGNSSVADKDRQASRETEPIVALAGDSTIDQARDSSGSAAVGSAFRDKDSAGKLGTSLEGVERKSTTSTHGTPASVGRQVPDRFAQDRQSDGNAPNRSPDPEILKPASGQQDILAPAAARAVSPNNEPPASARSVQLPEPIEAPRLSPANQMTVRVEGGSGQTISVRFLNQGGHVDVAVRSSDPAAVSQLRQELTSLTGNLERIGWKADLTGTPGHQTPALHEGSGSDRNSQGSYKGSTLEWEEGPPKKKSPAPEFWDELRDRHDT